MVSLKMFVDKFGKHIRWKELCKNVHMYLEELTERYADVSYENCSDPNELIEAYFADRVLCEFNGSWSVKQLNPKSEYFSRSPEEHYMEVVRLSANPKEVKDQYCYDSTVDNLYYRFYKLRLLKRINNKMEKLIWAEADPDGKIMPCPNRKHNHEDNSDHVCPVCKNIGYVTIKDIAKAVTDLPPNNYRIHEDYLRRAKVWQKKAIKNT